MQKSSSFKGSVCCVETFGYNLIWSLAKLRLPHPDLLPLWEGEGIRSAILGWLVMRFAIGRSFLQSKFRVELLKDASADFAEAGSYAPFTWLTREEKIGDR